MVNGTFDKWYNGLSGIKVAEHFDISIYYPLMLRHLKDEDKYGNSNVHHLRFTVWLDWMKQLANFRYAINMMPTVAAGTFSANCAVLGIPCIGNQEIDTQRICFPDLSIHPYDLTNAVKLLKKLMTDKKFYKEQADMGLKNIEYFSADSMKKQFYEDIKEL